MDNFDYNSISWPQGHSWENHPNKHVKTTKENNMICGEKRTFWRRRKAILYKARCARLDSDKSNFDAFLWWTYYHQYSRRGGTIEEVGGENRYWGARVFWGVWFWDEQATSSGDIMWTKNTPENTKKLGGADARRHRTLPRFFLALPHFIYCADFQRLWDKVQIRVYCAMYWNYDKIERICRIDNGSKGRI